MSCVCCIVHFSYSACEYQLQTEVCCAAGSVRGTGLCTQRGCGNARRVNISLLTVRYVQERVCPFSAKYFNALFYALSESCLTRAHETYSSSVPKGCELRVLQNLYFKLLQPIRICAYSFPAPFYLPEYRYLSERSELILYFRCIHRSRCLLQLLST